MAPTEQPTTAPTGAPTAPQCASTESYVRLLKRSAATGVWAPVSQLIRLPNYQTFLHASVQVMATRGDVYKFQWLSPCPLLALTPQPLNLAQLQLPGGTLPISALWVLQ